MRIKQVLVAVSLAVGVSQVALANTTTFEVTEDVMTSSFFTGTNLVRGYAAESNRPVMRVSSNNPFGTSGAETIYLNFDNDFSSFASGYTATLTVQSAAGGFGGDASAAKPFLVSAHGVNANPFTSILDDTNPTGTTDWKSFYNNSILTASDSVSVNRFGAITFDVTSIVSSWATGSNTNQFIALTGKNDTSGNDFLHGFLNNNNGGTNAGNTFLTISAVPEPQTYALLLAGLGLVGFSSRKQ